MNKNLKIALIVLSTLLVSILSVRQCINEYGDMASIMYNSSNMSDNTDNSSQEGTIYKLNKKGDYRRIKGKKLFRDPRNIAKDYYLYITNSSFSNISKFTRTRKKGDPNFSMGASYPIYKDGKYIEPIFTVLDYRNKKISSVPGISLISGLIEEIEEDMNFDYMTTMLENQIDEIWKKMYPEDSVLLDKIKSEITENITIYTNMPNHLKTKHTWDYEVKFGQQYGMFITRYISPYTDKHFYTLNLTRRHIAL